jgi:hypothetical protein
MRTSPLTQEVEDGPQFVAPRRGGAAALLRSEYLAISGSNFSGAQRWPAIYLGARRGRLMAALRPYCPQPWPVVRSRGWPMCQASGPSETV